MPFQSSTDSWAIVEVLWEEVITGALERTVPPEHSTSRRETAAHGVVQAGTTPAEEGGE